MRKSDRNRLYDQYMKEAFDRSLNGITASDTLFDRTMTEINLKNQEDVSMNKFLQSKKMKPVLIAALVLLLSTATSLGASHIVGLIGYTTDVFEDLPTDKQIEKRVNYVPDYVEEFTNGFTFDNASVDKTYALDSNGNKSYGYTGIHFHYKKGDNKNAERVNLSTAPEDPAITSDLKSNAELIPEGDLDLFYSKVIFKLVPGDYEITEEEQQKIDEGVLWISTDGSSAPASASDIQYVNWVKDDIVYSLSNGGTLSKDELLNMAREVINSANL